MSAKQSGSRYTTVDVYPTGSGKKDCNRAVYHEGKTIKVEIIVIVEVIIDNKPSYSTVETKPGQPTSTPSPITYSSSETTSSSYSQGTGYSTGTGNGAPPKVFDVELRNDNGTFHYVPDRINAKVNDIVNFIFKPKAHSVTQSTFNTPCSKLMGGFDTELVNGSISGNITRQYTVTDDSKPLWFYCKAQGPPNHCGVGMVFGINPGNKMDEFIAKAKAQNGPNGNGTSSTSSTATATTSGTYSTDSATATYGGAKATTTVVVSGGFNASANVNTLKYEPPFLKRATAGDVVVFDFRKLNHTVTESSFDNPCKKLNKDAFDTNFNDFNKDDVPGLKLERFTLPDDKPHYFYCKQANGQPNGHCSNGMVFAINIDEKRFGDFKTNAEATKPKA